MSLWLLSEQIQPEISGVARIGSATFFYASTAVIYYFPVGGIDCATSIACNRWRCSLCA
jgi:hypothetical protein